MRYLKLTLKILAGVAGLFVIVGLLLPSTAHVERKILVQKGPEQIFPYLTNFRRFNQWSPWAGIDPATSYVFEGPDSGMGAKMSWSSEHPNVGKGSQTIIKSEPFTRVETALDFMEEGKATAFFKLTPQGLQTEVVWGFETDFGWNLFARYFGLMFDKFIGPDYEKGLAKLKQLVESAP